jgi:hypothetical protein
MRARTLSTIGFLSMISLALATTDALARDVCLGDSFGNTYVFSKVKALKPGQAVPLAGLFVSVSDPTTAYPLTGVGLAAKTSPTARFGIFVHALGLTTNNFTIEWSGSPTTYAGSGFYDFDGEYAAEDSITFTSTDCGAVAIP